MTRALSAVQVDQVVENTLLALLPRRDLLPAWHEALWALLRQVQTADQEDEAVFLAAVLTLLASPGDTLPTGTRYDPAWRDILAGLKTGAAAVRRQTETSELAGLLTSVAEAALAVLTDAPDERPAIAEQIRDVRAAAEASGLGALAAWLRDVGALLDGTPPAAIEAAHEGVYRDYWRALIEHLTFFED